MYYYAVKNKISYFVNCVNFHFVNAHDLIHGICCVK